MNKTKIEYLTHTWNPIAMRCTLVSEGCRNCWHLAMAKRLAKNPMIDRNRQDAYKGGVPLLDEKELEAPLHLKKPARIGVQFMGDLFHENISYDFLHQIFRVMENCSRDHKFLILTKRLQRAKNWLQEYYKPTYIGSTLVDPNYVDNRIWLGVSISNQSDADRWIPILLQIPAAHRWVSVEPMLGPVNLGEWLGVRRYTTLDGLPEKPYWKRLIGTPLLGILDWVVCGGETGPGARPMNLRWARDLLDQCQSAGVPFFFKSVGDNRLDYIGKPPKSTKHLLDGKEWREIPNGG